MGREFINATNHFMLRAYYLKVGSILPPDDLPSTITTSLLPPKDKTKPIINEIVPRKNPKNPDITATIVPPRAAPAAVVTYSTLSALSTLLNISDPTPRLKNVVLNGSKNQQTPKSKKPLPKHLRNVGANVTNNITSPEIT